MNSLIQHCAVEVSTSKRAYTLVGRTPCNSTVLAVSRRPPRITCMGKGFGSPAKVAANKTGKGGNPKIQEVPVGSAAAENTDICPCGSGDKKSYKECCGRFHGGVKEADPETLLRARFAAFAKGVIPYLVRTTHPDNPNMKEGPEQLGADCKETCHRLVFKRLEVLSKEQGQSDTEEEISSRVVYAYKHGTTTENQLLIEKSRFQKVGDRWLYREKLPMDAVSDALWRHGALLSEEPQQQVVPKGIFGRAQPKLRPRGR